MTFVHHSLAKAQKEKENLKKAELEAERVKQEELAKQRELAKPKPLLATPTAQQASVSLLAKPKEVAEKPAPKQTTTAPPSSVGSSLFGNLSKPNFGSPSQITSTPIQKSVETKPLFGGDKVQSPFGITTEKPITKSEPVPNLSTSLSKTVSFDSAATATSSGFSFGPKTEPANVSSSTASTGFSFGGSAKTPSFGLTTQTKTDALNLAKPATTPASVANEPKPALLQTPNTSLKETLQTTPVASSGFNITPKSSTVKSSPLLATPNIPPQQPNIANPSNVTSSAFKFDLGSSFGLQALEKSKSDKENTPIATTVTITKTSSIGSFSFLSGSATSQASSTPPAKSNTPIVATVQAPPVTSSISTSVSTQSLTPAASVATPSSIGFSFAKASAETPLGTSTANASITTTGVSSSSDVGSIFQGFNVCKPNVAENENGK